MVLLVLVLSTHAYAQNGLGEAWLPTTDDLSSVTLDGFQSVAFDPNSGVYIAVRRATSDHVFRSVDGGETWSEITVPIRWYWDVATDGNGTWILAAGRLDGGGPGADMAYTAFSKSTDNGVTWQDVPFEVDSQTVSLAASQVAYVEGQTAGQGRWFLGTPHGDDSVNTGYNTTRGLLYSDDGGASWTSTDWSKAEVYGIGVSPDGQEVIVSLDVRTVNQCVNDPNTDCGIWWSSDRGQTFVKKQDVNQLFLGHFAYSSNQDEWWAIDESGTGGETLYKSQSDQTFADSGFDLNEVPGQFGRDALMSLAIGNDDDDNEVFILGGKVNVGESNGLWRSTDYGATWEFVQPPQGASRIRGLAYGTDAGGNARFVAVQLNTQGPIFYTQGPAVPPDAPTNLSTTSRNGAIDIAFTLPTVPSDAPITDIEYSTDDGTTWKSAGSTTSPITITQLSESASNLVVGTEYTIRVRAVNRGGEGAASDPVTGEAGALPGVPTNVSAVQIGNDVTVSWSAPASDGGSPITTYTVQSLEGGWVYGQSPTCQTQSVNGALPATECKFTGLNSNTSWSFKVRAETVIGAGAYSDPAVEPMVVPDRAPTINQVLQLPSGDIDLRLIGITGAGYTDYVITINPDGTTQDCTYSYFGSCIVTELTVGSTYTFTAAVKNAAGTGPASMPTNQVVSVATPGAPTGVTATAGNAEATVSWVAPQNTGGAAIATYTAQVVGDSLSKCTATAPATTCQISGLQNGIEYQFEVIANNGVFDSVASSPSAAVKPTAAGPASKLVISINGKITSIDPQLRNLPFSASVALTDKDGNVVPNTDANATITLTANGGAEAGGALAKVGAIGQPVTVTLPVGQSSVAVPNLLFTGLSADAGGDITVSALAAGGLADGKQGTSAPFSVRDIKLLVEADDTSIAADGQSTATITVTLTDANDVAQSAQDIRITTDKGTLTSGGNPVLETDVFPTDANGQVSFTLQSDTSPGKATLTAYCPGACPATLEVSFFSQEAVDAIKDFDASTDDAPTADDYEKAGVTGVDEDSLDAINSVIDSLPAADRDTPEKIQVVADTVNDLLEKADGDASTPPQLDADDYAVIGLTEIDETEEVSLMNTVVAVQTPETLFPFEKLEGLATTVVDVIALADTGVDPQFTVKRLSDVGLRSVNPLTLSAVVAAIKDATVDEVDTLAKLQGIVDGVIDEVIATTIGLFDADSSTTPPSADDYANVGITGVTTTTLPVVNSIVGSLPSSDRDSAEELQAIVDVVDEILQTANGDIDSLPDLTAEDYAAIGLTEIDTTEEINLMNFALGVAIGSEEINFEGLKTLESKASRMIRVASGETLTGDDALAVEDFEGLGIEGVTEDNLAAVVAALAETSGPITPDTLQALVDQVIAEQVGPALPVPTLHMWSMLLLMMLMLLMAQRTFPLTQGHRHT